MSYMLHIRTYNCHICNIYGSFSYKFTYDFNIHVDDPFDSNAIQFLSLLDHDNRIQHVKFPTHQHSHTLDLVITSAASTLSPILTCLPVSPTDHFPIICSLNITPPARAPIIKRLTRAVTSIDASKFSHDILYSRLITHPLL
jgi:hypothetical protein